MIVRYGIALATGACLSLPYAAQAQESVDSYSLKCVQGVVDLGTSTKVEGAGFTKTFFDALLDVFSSAVEHDRRVVSDFGRVVTKVRGMKESLNSELIQFLEVPTDQHWQQTQEALKSVLFAVSSASLEMDKAFAGTSFAKGGDYSRLRTALEGSGYFTLCNIAGRKPDTPNDLASLRKLQSRLETQIKNMRDGEERIAKFVAGG